VKIMQEGLGSLRGAIGTPDQVADLCRRYEAAGVDQVIFVSQAGRNRHEHICESLELFATEVMPEFAERAEEREREKGTRLSEAVDEALARRGPPRIADPDYVIEPLDSGPPPARVGAGAERPPRAARDGDGRLAPALAAALEKRGEAAVAGFVRRSDDRRLERTVGSDPGLRIVFGGMTRRFRRDKAAGFRGDIQYDLRSSRGRPRPWVVSIDGERATARPGRSPDPKLTIGIELADFARLIVRELDPARALVDGRLQLEGDVTVAMRLGEMFGEPSPV
jgi:putative sterol carrier protein